MSTDKAELRRLAEAATPGPWSTLQRGRYWHEEEADVVDAEGVEVLGVEFVKPIGDVYTTRGQVYADDATYVAAANPLVVLALLDEIDALRDDAARWRFIRDEPYTPEVWHVLDVQANASMDSVVDAAIRARTTNQAKEAE